MLLVNISWSDFQPGSCHDQLPGFFVTALRLAAVKPRLIYRKDAIEEPRDTAYRARVSHLSPDPRLNWLWGDVGPMGLGGWIVSSPVSPGPLYSSRSWMRNDREDDGDDRTNEFAGYFVAVIFIVVLILFSSTSPRTGVMSAAIFLIVVGLAVLVMRKLIR
jgi:hypothetical protein